MRVKRVVVVRCFAHRTEIENPAPKTATRRGEGYIRKGPVRTNNKSRTPAQRRFCYNTAPIGFIISPLRTKRHSALGVISVLTPRIDQTRGMRVVARRGEGSDRAEITTLAEWLPPLFGAIF